MPNRNSGKRRLEHSSRSTALNNPSHDHHFVPVFYLKNWIVGPEKRLAEFADRKHVGVKGRWTGPKGTGYEKFLYDSKDGRSHSLEATFFEPTDSLAAVAMATFFSKGPDLDWTPRLRSAWTRFLMTMMMRHPEDLETFRRTMWEDWTNLTEEMKQAYLSQKPGNFAGTAEEWWESNRDELMETAMLRTLRGLMDNANVGAVINGMAWNTAILEPATVPLLTSDRPVLTTTSLTEEDAFIIMPLSPTRLFVAVRREETMATIRGWSIDELVQIVNDEVVARAELRFRF
ncbi:DUF4238 domain-containing protein [Rhizobium leguminosarum bv. viciae]|uniref:DUF4238 domain-containing protein n=1 Tax=Rhizobium leguminosarum TaxID=384 RepID=UPI00103D4AC3|nr:DUF4238 domain-containing protein [Rhizobium leguminosarum]TCA18563.1 DUF4238 domain-containing protein [Rhizobium leguminosarum bv. viciae]